MSNLFKFNIIVLTVASAALSSCASLALGPYSYSDLSEPASQKGTQKQKELTQAEITQAEISIPYESVCRLATVRHKLGGLLKSNSFGSAALIEDRFLLTAAHNVFDYPFNKMMSVTVTCGDTDMLGAIVLAELDRDDIKDQVHVPRYEFRTPNTRKSYEHDYAFIDLGKKLSRRSNFSLGPLAMDTIPAEVFIAGYPGGNISGDASKDGEHMYKGKSTQTSSNLNHVNYDIDTKTGNSGGPVWIGDSAPYPIVAVHIQNMGGRLVNETLIDDWKDWRRTRN